MGAWEAECPVSKHIAHACRCDPHPKYTLASPRLWCSEAVCHAAELRSLKGYGSECLRAAPHLLVVIYQQTLPHLSLLQALLGILQLLQTHKELSQHAAHSQRLIVQHQHAEAVAVCCCAGRILLLPAQLLPEACDARRCLKRPLTFLTVLSSESATAARDSAYSALTCILCSSACRQEGSGSVK